MTTDVHAHVANLENPKVAQMHADAEVFDSRTEVSVGAANWEGKLLSLILQFRTLLPWLLCILNGDTSSCVH